MEAGATQGTRSGEALEALCLTYWKPLYAFLRRRGHSKQDSQDLVQGLFHHLLQRREFFKRADRNQGQFRCFLLGALKHFLADTKAKESALKRGGGTAARIALDIDAMDEVLGDPNSEDPSEAYDRQWAMTALNEAVQRLRTKAEKANQVELHEIVYAYISGKLGKRSPRELASELELTEDAFKMKATRMRQALRASLNDVVAETVADFSALPGELAYLKGLMIKSF